MKKQAEYKEGKEARENFEKLGKVLFQSPKPDTTKKRQAGKPTSAKKSGKSGS